MVYPPKADVVRLYLVNKKNGQRCSTKYYDAFHHAFCPIKSISNHINSLCYIVTEDASLPVSYVGNIQHITTNNSTLEIWEGVVLSELLNSG